MPLPSIDEVSDLWHCDGSLRDIYILGTDLADWQRFLVLTENHSSKYLFEGEMSPLPLASEIFLNREGSHLLALQIGAAQVNCHFFIAEEIELDIDPRQIATPSDHCAVLEFMGEVAYALRKPAHLTPESSEDTPFLTFDPTLDSWYIHG